MNEEQLKALINTIRQFPPQVIGFDANGDEQKIFNKGWIAAKEQIMGHLAALGIDPYGTDEE